MPFGRCGPFRLGVPGRSGNSAPRAARHEEMILQIVAEHAARVRQAARRLPGPRVEQDAGRLERLRREDDDPAEHLLRLARVAVDVEQAPRAVRTRGHQHLIHHRVWNVRAVARLERVCDGGERGVEVGVGDAPALARPAIVAWRPPIDRPRVVGHAPHRHRPSQLRFHPRAKPHLGTSCPSAGETCRRAAPRHPPEGR